MAVDPGAAVGRGLGQQVDAGEHAQAVAVGVAAEGGGVSRGGIAGARSELPGGDGQCPGQLAALYFFVDHQRGAERVIAQVRHGDVQPQGVGEHAQVFHAQHVRQRRVTVVMTAGHQQALAAIDRLAQFLRHLIIQYLVAAEDGLVGVAVALGVQLSPAMKSINRLCYTMFKQV